MKIQINELLIIGLSKSLFYNFIMKMISISHFKKGAIILQFNTAVTDLKVLGILTSHCRRNMNTEYTHLIGYKCTVFSLKNANDVSTY
jgi:hypothetical protein